MAKWKRRMDLYSKMGWFWTTELVWSNRDPDWILWLYEQTSARWVGYYIYEPIGKTLLNPGQTFWDPQTQKDLFMSKI